MLMSVCVCVHCRSDRKVMIIVSMNVYKSARMQQENAKFI